MIHNAFYTDWMVRGRAADEYDTARGGGVVFRQAPHGTRYTAAPRATAGDALL